MAPAPDGTAAAASEPFTYLSRDGLQLFGRDYRAAASSRLPVVCLPGLTRTSRDFDVLARLLSSGPGARRVVSFDLRGRGRSEYDPTGAGYLPATEAQDVLDGLADRGIARAAFVGTSRGGIVTMVLAGMAPAVVAAAVLNDIGSLIETAGLMRIRAHVGVALPALDWPMAERALAARLGDEFPAFGPADWARQARLTFADAGGTPVLDYDPKLAEGFHALTPETPPVDLGAAFATLAAVPVLVVRGACSHLLSAATVDAMRAAHPRLESVEVPGQGHPPELTGAVASRIADFLDGLDSID
ncbi:MAG: alpha/beta hydrolase [Rhizobiales bacterium]|nr:alpha/beta hydrolase [Hyphomicrobiales bacterium]